MWFCDHINETSPVYTHDEAVALCEAYIARNNEELETLKMGKQVRSPPPCVFFFFGPRRPPCLAHHVCPPLDTVDTYTGSTAGSAAKYGDDRAGERAGVSYVGGVGDDL
jgi:hypothetical protein